MRDRLGPVVDPLPATAGDQVASSVQDVSEDPVDDAQRALLALGYKSPEVGRMLKRIDCADKGSEEIIRLALKASLK